jgi:hypothetical protein
MQKNNFLKPAVSLTLLSRPRLNSIFGRQKAHNALTKLGDSLENRFLELNKVSFNTPRMQKIILQGLRNTRNIDFRPRPSRILGWLEGKK